MAIKLGVPKETTNNERRVALVPPVSTRLQDLGFDISIESGAGSAAGIPDRLFEQINIAAAEQVFSGNQIIFKVQPPAASEIDQMQAGSIVIGFMHAHLNPDMVRKLQERNITAFAIELVPRISRAQSMDALSSQAAVAGYKATLIAADKLRRFFPMLTTAAGTIRPAKVLVIGAGVAGLQAIATAKRLGAMVEGFDVRSATKEQVESLGAKFIDTGVKAEGEGGYARELTDEEKQQQQQVLAEHIAQADAIITTAAIPGRPAPKIITTGMVDNMKAGSVIVDLAAETGGNCELTKAGEDVAHGETIVAGPVNLPSMLAEHASEMYARNLLNFVTPMVDEGQLKIDWEDEVYAQSVLTHAGEIKHAPTRELVEGTR
ncbi:MAG: Re/Si-specific NAD(P)(+) transhydrogenase subunit alpha [Gammaproteobacteria bacterium]|nr:Re/Si-specific NAD(P)(+) transhydrogenase subunit alpha [Gammaproteobacteria bacterium]